MEDRFGLLPGESAFFLQQFFVPFGFAWVSGSPWFVF
jgi:hypothetical protein